MARSRNIKPGIMDNEQLATLDPMARLLFIYMWMLADKSGRLEDRPARIKKQALGYDMCADVDALLSSLAREGFIVRYRVANQSLIEIVNFSKHQTPHVREADSELPGPELADDQQGTCTEQGSDEALPRQCLAPDKASPRSPDSLIPDSLIPDTGFLIPDSDATGPSGPVVSDAERRFDDFWRQYPRKVGKDDARKAFAKRKPTDALLADMLAALAWQRESSDWLKDGGQYIPHPATWLNRGSWQDERPPPKPRPPNRRELGEIEAHSIAGEWLTGGGLQ